MQLFVLRSHIYILHPDILKVMTTWLSLSCILLDTSSNIGHRFAHIWLEIIVVEELLTRGLYYGYWCIRCIDSGVNLCTWFVTISLHYFRENHVVLVLIVLVRCQALRVIPTLNTTASRFLWHHLYLVFSIFKVWFQVYRSHLEVLEGLRWLFDFAHVVWCKSLFWSIFNFLFLWLRQSEIIAYLIDCAIKAFQRTNLTMHKLGMFSINLIGKFFFISNHLNAFAALYYLLSY